MGRKSVDLGKDHTRGSGCAFKESSLRKHEPPALSASKLVASLERVEFAAPLGLILLCEKCGRKAGSSDNNLARRTQKNLKHESNDRFGKKQVRALLSPCFDICPKGKIVACVVPMETGHGKKTQFVQFAADDTEAAASALLDLLR